MVKISILKQEGMMEKISYEGRVYESVDDEGRSWVISQNLTEKEFGSLMS